MNKHTAQIQFIGTTDDSLIEKLKNSLIPELEARLSKQFQPKLPTEYLTRAEVCELLKIDLSTLWRWTKNKTFNAYGIQNRVFYKRSEIERYMDNSKIN